MRTAVRWVGALVGAILVLYIGGTCVEVTTGVFLDPMWNAPLEE